MQLYKTVFLLVAFLVIAFLKGFIGFIRGRLTWDGWCLTSVIAEGRLVLCRSIDPKPTRTWSLEPPTLMSDWFTDDWHLLAGSQDPRNSGMLWLVTHPRYMRCFYLLTPVFSITCRWVAVRSAGLPIAIVCKEVDRQVLQSIAFNVHFTVQHMICKLRLLLHFTSNTIINICFSKWNPLHFVTILNVAVYTVK